MGLGRVPPRFRARSLREPREIGRGQKSGTKKAESEDFFPSLKPILNGLELVGLPSNTLQSSSKLVVTDNSQSVIHRIQHHDHNA